MSGRIPVPASGPRLAGLILLLGASAGLARAQQSAGRWIDVDLPADFHLDLATGDVTSRPPDDSPGTLTYHDGTLLAWPRLGRWPRSGAERVSTRVVRHGGTPVDRPDVQVGDELVFELGPAGWGYLRVISTDPGGVRLEYARGDPASPILERDPPWVEALQEGGLFHLRWPAPDGQATYRVERTVLGDRAAPSAHLVTGGEWLDPTPPPGSVIEYRVRRAGTTHPFGIRVRRAPIVQPGEWPQPLVRGLRLNLLTGATGEGVAHLEVVQATPPGLILRPLPGTGLVTLPPGPPSWELPPGEGGGYQDQVRALSPGDRLGVRLPEGIYGRLSFQVVGGRTALLRQVDLEGGRLLPVPPEPPRVRWTPSGPSFEFEPLGSGVPQAASVHLVVERELGYLRGDWEELGVGAPGTRVVAASPPASEEDPPLARFRFRHRYPWGPQSLAGEPVPVLLGDRGDPRQVDRWLTGAFEDLLHPNFDRRIAARGVLESLGPLALPRLEQALRSPEAELASAARDILVAVAREGGRHVELLLRARAMGEGIEAPPPPGLLDPRPERRAWALLRALAGVAAGTPGADPPTLEAWRRILALADPDEGVADLAALLQRVEERVGPFEGPYGGDPGEALVLTPPGARPRPPALDWRWVVVESAPHEVARRVRRALDPSHLESALVMLRVAHELEGGRVAHWSDHPGGAETVELALRLVDRYRAGEEPALLQAAEALVSDPGARLAAARELMARRLGGGGGAGPAPQRRRIELAAPGLAELEAQLASLVSAGEGYLDLVLPAGEYRGQGGAGGEEAWVDLAVPGLRLIGGPGVVLHAGLRLQGVRDVVLEGLTVENPRGSAILLSHASALVIDCTLSGAQTTVLLDRSLLELSGVELVPGPESRRSLWSVRLLGRARLWASASLFAAGTLASGSEGNVYLDRCVVDAGARAAIQGQRGDTVVLRDCLLRSEGVGLVGVGEGLALGVVFDTVRGPVGRGSTGPKVCPELHARTARTPALDRDLLLETCPYPVR